MMGGKKKIFFVFDSEMIENYSYSIGYIFPLVVVTFFGACCRMGRRKLIVRRGDLVVSCLLSLATKETVNSIFSVSKVDKWFIYHEGCGNWFVVKG